MKKQKMTAALNSMKKELEAQTIFNDDQLISICEGKGPDDSYDDYDRTRLVVCHTRRNLLETFAGHFECLNKIMEERD